MIDPIIGRVCQNLVATNPQALRRVLPEIGNLNGEQSVELMSEAVHALDATSSIPLSEKAMRLGWIAQAIPNDLQVFQKISQAARAFPDAFKNALAAAIPPEFRPLLYGTAVSQAGRVGTPSVPVFPDPELKNPQVSAAPLSKGYLTVLLLSKSDQLSNRKLLQDRGFGPLQYDDLDRFQQDLRSNTDICGCIIHSTLLSSLDAEGQRRLFKLLGEYSTFIWLRVDERGLRIESTELLQIIKRVRCQREQVGSHHLSIQPDGDLRESELGFLKRAASSLQGTDDTRFIPGELNDNEAAILIAAARQHAQELRLEGEIVVTSLRTEFLQGGPETAKVAVIRANKTGMPVIAKVHSKDAILREIERFRLFIQEWDDQLRPVACIHGGVGVIIFGLIPDERDPFRPAPVLDDRLEDLWNVELGFPPRSATPTEDNLVAGLENIVEAVKRLNQRPNTRHDIACVVNPDMRCFHRLEEKGVDWGLGDLANGARQVAELWFARLATAAIVHGDMHLGNIVLRGDRDAHLIDYAGSGPGHPAVDLVRLELALLTGWVKQFIPESRCQEFQVRFTQGLASYADLKAEFPDLFCSSLNRVCLGGCIHSRDAVLQVLSGYGGSTKDYYACKYLVAWQNLLMDGRQTVWSRATISAMKELVLNECDTPN